MRNAHYQQKRENIESYGIKEAICFTVTRRVLGEGREGTTTLRGVSTSFKIFSVEYYCFKMILKIYGSKENNLFSLFKMFYLYN